jgi:hypothetical protein
MKMKPIDPLPVFQAISVLGEPPVTFTRSGVAVILAVPLACRVSGPVLPRCAKSPAIHSDPKQTASQTAITENMEGKFAIAQDLSAVDNDKVLPVILLIMKPTFRFAGATCASAVSTRCWTWPDWLFQGSTSKNLK